MSKTAEHYIEQYDILRQGKNMSNAIRELVEMIQKDSAAPPPASEGEMADSKKIFDALVAIANNERLIADSVGDPILRGMHLENQKAAQRICRTIYGATLPTREPEGEGVIKISSKKDLPKERMYCWFYDKSKGWIAGEYLNNGKDEVNYILANATHYKPMVKPANP